MLGFNKNIRNLFFLRFFFVPLLIFAWVFSGWPQIWQNPDFPPQIETAQAGTAAYTVNFATTIEGFTYTSESCNGTCTNGYVSGSGNPLGSVFGKITGRNKKGLGYFYKSLTWQDMGVPAGAKVTQVDGRFDVQLFQETHTATNAAGLKLYDAANSVSIATGGVDIETEFDPTSSSWVTRNTDGSKGIQSAYADSATSVTIRMRLDANSGNNNSASTEIRADTLYFSITYNAPPSVVQNTPDANNFGTDTTPTLEFTGTDPESDAVRYNVQIDDSSNCLSPILDKVSGTDPGFAGTGAEPYTSGALASYTVQAGDALASGTYYWRARGIDPSGSNTYGSFSSIRSFTVSASTISIILDTDGSIAYGFVAQNSTQDTTSSGVNDTESVQNNGNVNEDFTIEGANTGSWMITTGAAGSDTYNHSWCTATCDSTPSWNPFNATPEALASGVTPTSSQAFDLQINTPNPSTVFTQQNATVTITASAS